MSVRSRWMLAVAGAAGVVGVAAVVISRAGTTDEIGADRIVMLGDSITEQGDWAALLPRRPIVNAGRSGFTTEQLVPVARTVAEREPAIVFVLTGTNDIRDDHPPEWTASHLHDLLDAIETASPSTTVVVQTILPRDDRPDAARATADAIRSVAESRGVRVLDLHGPFEDGAGGGLRADETTDGVHLSDDGYARWAALLDAELDQLDER